MKTAYKLACLFIIQCCFCHISFSQDTPDDDLPAKVYFIRHTGFEGSAVSFKAVINKEVVCKLANKRYSIHELPAGEHSFSVQFSGKQADPLTMHIEPGKTYYLYMVLQPGVMKTALYCIEITENAAQIFLKACEQHTKCL